MTDTRILKRQVEDHVRKVLKEEISQTFVSRKLVIGRRPDGTLATHEFDAVSADGTIVAGIKSSSGKTSGGKHPSGKVAAAYQELYFLSLVGAAKRRILVLTDPEFHKIFEKHSGGRLGHGIELKLITLPPELSAEVQLVHKATSQEMTGGAN
jgi:hypothetical protein